MTKFHLGDYVNAELTAELQPEMDRAAGEICLVMKNKRLGTIIYGFKANVYEDAKFYAQPKEYISAEEWEVLEDDGVTDCFIWEEENKLIEVGLEYDPLKKIEQQIKTEIGL